MEAIRLIMFIMIIFSPVIMVTAVGIIEEVIARKQHKKAVAERRMGLMQESILRMQKVIKAEQYAQYIADQRALRVITTMQPVVGRVEDSPPVIHRYDTLFEGLDEGDVWDTMPIQGKMSFGARYNHSVDEGLGHQSRARLRTRVDAKGNKHHHYPSRKPYEKK